MWLSCSPLSRLLFSRPWMWKASKTFLFHRLGSVSLTFAPSQSMWCCASHAWSVIPLLVPPQFTTSLRSVILFLPVSPMYRLSHSLQGISYTTPFFLRSGVGAFTRTRESLRLLDNLKTVLMSRHLHFLWISSKRSLMYSNLGLPSVVSCVVLLSLMVLRSECSIILFG